jgi:hypothetical protein
MVFPVDPHLYICHFKRTEAQEIFASAFFMISRWGQDFEAKIFFSLSLRRYSKKYMHQRHQKLALMQHQCCQSQCQVEISSDGDSTDADFAFF